MNEQQHCQRQAKHKRGKADLFVAPQPNPVPHWLQQSEQRTRFHRLPELSGYVIASSMQYAIGFRMCLLGLSAHCPPPLESGTRWRKDTQVTMCTTFNSPITTDSVLF